MNGNCEKKIEPGFRLSVVFLLTVFGSAFLYLVNILSKTFYPPVIRDYDI